MHRRTFLRGAVIAASSPIVVNEVQQFDLNEFMLRASPSERMHYLVGALAETMNEIRPDVMHIAKLDHAAGIATVMPV